MIAEVDEGTPSIRRQTVTVIDDRRPGQGPEVQLSDFSLLEDRETHALELLLTHYGEVPASVFTVNCYKDIVTLEAEGR